MSGGSSSSSSSGAGALFGGAGRPPLVCVVERFGAAFHVLRWARGLIGLGKAVTLRCVVCVWTVDCARQEYLKGCRIRTSLAFPSRIYVVTVQVLVA